MAIYLKKRGAGRTNGDKTLQTIAVVIGMFGLIIVSGFQNFSKAPLSPPGAYQCPRDLWCGQPRSSLQITGNSFGAHTTFLWEGNNVVTLPLAPGDDLQLISQAGFGWVKDYVYCKYNAGQVVQTGCGNGTKYNANAFFSEANALGLRPLIRIDFRYCDSTGIHCQYPPSTSDGWNAYASFAQLVVSQFGNYASDWEIGNEPNDLASVAPRYALQSPDLNASMIGVVAAAIKSAQPHARVYASAISQMESLYSNWGHGVDYFDYKFTFDANNQPIKNGLITQTPDVAQGNPGLGGGGPRVIQIGLKLKF